VNIAIITAPHNSQAETVRDSVKCFFEHGNFSYQVLELKRGELIEDINQFDALILHYSIIAFPYRYYLPISGFAALKIANFGGIKLAFVQDEQRACQERLKFLNNLEINHLFSVANEELFEILYPSNLRKFTVSTVLTGYISRRHLAVASRKVPLRERKLDVVYRGRKLPEWYGTTGTLKGAIPNIIESDPRMKKYLYSVSSVEHERIYGEKWMDFLQSGKISIATPSGSDYLDTEGNKVEAWVPNQEKSTKSPSELIRADYQVISPRFFDYVAAGNLIVLTPGHYSKVPIESLYCKTDNNLENLPEIIAFASSREAQRMVTQMQESILGDVRYRYSHLVEVVESKIVSLRHSTSIRHTELDESRLLEIKESIKIKYWLIKHLRNFIGMLPLKSLYLAWSRCLFVVQRSPRKVISKFQKIFGMKLSDFFSWKLIQELNILESFFANMGENRVFIQYSINSAVLVRLPRDSSNSYKTTTFHHNKVIKEWFIDISDFGTINFELHLKNLSRRLDYKTSNFERILHEYSQS